MLSIAHTKLSSTRWVTWRCQFDAGAVAQTRERESAATLTIRVVSGVFRQLQWQAEELTLLSSRTMAGQEAPARRFSRELHDEFGQSLSTLEANLVALQNASPRCP